MSFAHTARVFVAAVVALALTGTSASAGSVSITGVEPNYTSDVNLTAEGTTDWAIWNYTANPIATGSKTAAPSNRKAGVPARITSAITVNGDARGTSSSLPVTRYSYTDGVSPATLATPARQGILFDSTLQNATSGLSFSIAGGAAGVTQVAHLYLSGFSGSTPNLTPLLTLSLPGAANATDSSVTYGTGDRQITRYTVEFTPDNTGDALNVSFVSGSAAGSNSHAVLQAVTVSPIPEPASVALLATGAAAVLLRRRRRA